MDALEGTGEDEASVSKQMIVTVLMSSLLIYNSSEWSDLEDMRYVLVRGRGGRVGKAK